MPGSKVTSIASLNVDESGAMRAKSRQTTSHDIAKVQIEWRIKMFNSLMRLYKAGTELHSETVSSYLAPCAFWKLEVDPNGWQEEHSGYISIFFHLTGPMANGKESLDASYHICIRDEINNRTETIHQETTQFGPTDYVWGIERISHERVRRALQPDGSLLIIGEVEFFPPSSGKSGPKCPSSEQHQGVATDEAALLSKWRLSVGRLSVTGTNHDCILKVDPPFYFPTFSRRRIHYREGDVQVDGVKLKAHKGILSALSPTFKEMFGNPRFYEASKGVVRIEDFSVEPVKALLAYAYQGCIDWVVFGKYKCDVLRLAEKYMMDELKCYMEGLLTRSVNDQSLVDMALLADSHSCQVLKKACVHFLCSNYAHIMLTSQWGDLVRERGDVAADLLRLMRNGE